MVPILYRWDDTSAPAARGERRSLVDILRACLVDGYGTKAAAGWTLEYINATFDKAAFRNNRATGTGFYLQVDGLGGANAYTPNIQGFEAMTSENDGLLPFNAAGTWMFTSSTADSVARPWVLVADDRAFYLIIWTGNTGTPLSETTGAPSLYFGDMVASNLADSFMCGLAGSAAIATGGFGLTATNATATSSKDRSFSLPRTAEGSVGSSHICTLVPVGPGIDAPLIIGSISNSIAYTVGDQIYIARPFVNNGAVKTFRGWLPGLYYPCHVKPFSQLEQVVLDGKTYFSLIHRIGGSNSVSGDANYLISLDDWRV